MDEAVNVTEADIVDGLRRLGLNKSSSVIVHSSLRSFGHVDGGAQAVCRALVGTCGTVMMLAASWDHTGDLPAPPGLVRPHNAYYNAETWESFDDALAGVVPFALDLPVARWLGRIAETLRQSFPNDRSAHPLFSFLATDRVRAYLKGQAEHAWNLANWLDHYANATNWDAELVLDATSHAIATFGIAVHRHEKGHPERCPKCSSYRVYTDTEYDPDTEISSQNKICAACEHEWDFAKKMFRLGEGWIEIIDDSVLRG